MSSKKKLGQWNWKVIYGNRLIWKERKEDNITHSGSC